MKVARRRAVVYAAVTSALVWAGEAGAGTARVALVKPESSDSTIVEAVNRIRGELVAEGFEVVVVDVQPETDPTGNAGEDRSGSVATIGLSVDEGTHIAELRVFDRLTNKTVVRRSPVLDSATPHTAEVLAVRAVELLRASLLELVMTRPSTSEPAPPPSSEVRQASRWAARTLPVETERTWGFDAGVGVLADFGGIPPALVGVVRLRREVVGPFGLRVTFAGLGTAAHVDVQEGSARVNQGLGLVEGTLALWPKFVVHPVLSLGAGPLFASVEGQASYPYLGKSSSEWALAADAGAGAAIRMGQHFDLALEGHVFVARPYPVVEILGTDAARSGQPSVLGSVSVVGWL